MANTNRFHIKNHKMEKNQNQRTNKYKSKIERKFEIIDYLYKNTDSNKQLRASKLVKPLKYSQPHISAILIELLKEGIVERNKKGFFINKKKTVAEFYKSPLYKLYTYEAFNRGSMDNFSKLPRSLNRDVGEHGQKEVLESNTNLLQRIKNKVKKEGAKSLTNQEITQYFGAIAMCFQEDYTGDNKVHLVLKKIIEAKSEVFRDL
jgi:DNA-binding transcriptional regulator GbsR (MarR family)